MLGECCGTWETIFQTKLVRFSGSRRLELEAYLHSELFVGTRTLAGHAVMGGTLGYIAGDSEIGFDPRQKGCRGGCLTQVSCAKSWGRDNCAPPAHAYTSRRLRTPAAIGTQARVPRHGCPRHIICRIRQRPVLP